MHRRGVAAQVHATEGRTKQQRHVALQVSCRMLDTIIQNVTTFVIDVQADTGLVVVCESVSNMQGAHLLLRRVPLTRGLHPTRFHTLPQR